MKVDTDNLGSAILKELTVYTEEVEQKVAQAVVTVGRQTAKDLKAVNQVAGSNVWRNYPKGWTTKNTKQKGKQISEVHNATEYRLTHLLEKGHVIKNGTGRTYGRTRKFPHISIADEKAVDELEKRIKEVI